MPTLMVPGSLVTRDRIQAHYTTDIVGALVGTVGYGQLIRLVDKEDATNYANILGNKDTTNGRAVKIQYGDHAGTPVTLATFAKAAITLDLPATIKQASLANPASGYTSFGARTSDGAPVFRASGGAETVLANAADSPSTILTTTGDIIYASAPSTGARLGIGTTGQGLYVVGGLPAWGASTKSTLTTTGDIVYASSANTLARLAVGSTNFMLSVTGGVPAWKASATSVLTTTGDVLYASGANTLARLGIGTTNFVLGVVGGVPAWIASPTSVLTTTGDILYASGANTLARLGVGSDGDVLKLAAGLPSWSSTSTTLTSVEGALSGDVLLNNTANFFDGPSVSLTAGTWFVVGAVQVTDSAGAAAIVGKLWDGTTVESSGQYGVPSAGFSGQVTLAGIVAPGSTTTYKISCRDVSSTSGSILAATPGSSQGNNASYLRAVKIA
jgi:hypothetical protein